MSKGHCHDMRVVTKLQTETVSWLNRTWSAYRAEERATGARSFRKCCRLLCMAACRFGGFVEDWLPSCSDDSRRQQREPSFLLLPRRRVLMRRSQHTAYTDPAVAIQTSCLESRTYVLATFSRRRLALVVSPLARIAKQSLMLTLPLCFVNTFVV